MSILIVLNWPFTHLIIGNLHHFPTIGVKASVVNIVYYYQWLRGNYIWVGVMVVQDRKVKIEKFDSVNFDFQNADYMY